MPSDCVQIEAVIRFSLVVGRRDDDRGSNPVSCTPQHHGGGADNIGVVP